MAYRASLISVPAHLPFAATVAERLLEWAENNPFALAQMRILLPTRRAVQALEQAFLQATGGKPLLLPRMHPIQEVEEEELLLSGLLAPDEAPDLGLKPAMPPVQRYVLLGRLIHKYGNQVSPESMSMEQAITLARHLSAFMDEVQEEGLSWENLSSIVPEELAGHWQKTLEFIHLVVNHWGAILNEQQKTDPVERRHKALNLLARFWKEYPPQTPVIIAGVADANAALLELMQVVRRLPKGMVMLSALDKDMSVDEWDFLSHMEEDGSSQQQHPQYGLRHLLHCLKAGRDEVDTPELPPTPRGELLRHVFMPAEMTRHWGDARVDWRAAISGLHRIDCATEQEEALVVALLMREQLECAGKTAALITSHRGLARRVAAHLRRFGVEVDDSAGIPLNHTPAAVFLFLLLEAALHPASPHALLALLKHPLCRMGESAASMREKARKLEKRYLRGVRRFACLQELAAQMGEGDAELKALLTTLSDMFAQMNADDSQPFATWLQRHIEVAEQLSRTAEGAFLLWQREESETLTRFVFQLFRDTGGLSAGYAGEYAGMLKALFAGQTFRKTYGQHARLHILNPRQARMLSFDRVILSGLNVGGFADESAQDPWMSRPMRVQFGLDLPERKLGEAAHDFYVLAHGGEVFLTRAEKEEGSPALASSWLYRMDALLQVLGGDEACTALRAEGRRWCYFARNLDRAETVQPVAEPLPRPPVSLRPRALSATAIETLFKNPYAIYAQRILKLYKLDAVDMPPSYREFGNVVHEALDAYTRRNGQTVEQLHEHGREAFVKAYGERPEIHATWWPRFAALAESFVQWHSAALEARAEVWSEIKASYALSLPAGAFTVHARLDRAELYPDGTAHVIDYKTTSLPSQTAVRRLARPQLFVQALVALFGTLPEGKRVDEVTEIAFWKLGHSSEKKPVNVGSKQHPLTIRQFVEEGLQALEEFLSAFDDAATPYRHAPHSAFKPSYDDYAHLARAGEWREDMG